MSRSRNYQRTRVASTSARSKFIARRREHAAHLAAVEALDGEREYRDHELAGRLVYWTQWARVLISRDAGGRWRRRRGRAFYRRWDDQVRRKVRALNMAHAAMFPAVFPVGYLSLPYRDGDQIFSETL